MTEVRLTAQIRVRACLRLADLAGVSAMVVRRGFAEAGAILIKLNLLDGRARVLVQTRDAAGAPAWMAGTGPQAVTDAEAEAYLARAIGRDPDSWVIEIEDRQGRHFMPEPIIGE